MRNLVLCLILISSIFYNSCSTKMSNSVKNNDKPVKDELLFEEKHDPYVVVYIKRTSCFGNCPAYEAKIFSNGKVSYYGQSNVEKRGNFTSSVELDKINLLVKKAFDIQYFLLDDQYPDPSIHITDAPTTFTSIVCKGHNKSIANKFDGPLKLIDFEKEIDNLLNSITYTSIDPVK